MGNTLGSEKISKSPAASYYKLNAKEDEKPRVKQTIKGRKQFTRLPNSSDKYLFHQLIE